MMKKSVRQFSTYTGISAFYEKIPLRCIYIYIYIYANTVSDMPLMKTPVPHMASSKMNSGRGRVPWNININTERCCAEAQPQSAEDAFRPISGLISPARLRSDTLLREAFQGACTTLVGRMENICEHSEWHAFDENTGPAYGELQDEFWQRSCPVIYKYKHRKVLCRGSTSVSWRRVSPYIRAHQSS